MLFHAGAPGVNGGFTGVDVFFVISGFLITGLLWAELQQTGRVSFARFYARRARRILPAATVALVATVAVSEWALPPLAAHRVADDGLWSALFGANYRFATVGTDYLAAASTPSPLQHFWSLGVEEQFYLVWPALLAVAAVALLRRPSRLRAVLVLGLAVVVSFALSWRLSTTSPPWAFFSAWTRVWQLGVGALLALAGPWLLRLRPTVAASLAWLGLGGVVASMLLVGGSRPYPGVVALAPVLAAVLFLAGGTVQSRWSPRLSWAPVQRVGDASYSWYLWHWPVLVLGPALVGRALGGGGRAVLVAIGAVLAVVSWRFVELPARRAVRLRRPRPAFTLAGALAAASLVTTSALVDLVPAAASGGVAVAQPLLPAIPSVAASVEPGTTTPATRATSTAPAGPVPQVVAGRGALTKAERAVRAAVTAGVGITAVPANVAPPLRYAHGDKATPFNDGCHLEFVQTSLGRCAYANVASHTTVMLFGDSHATQWFPALLRVAQTRGWRLESLTKSTCPPQELSIFSPYLGRPYRECDQWRTKVLARIRAERPALVVLGVARHYNNEYHFQMYGRPWLDAFQTTVREIESYGSAVVVLGPTPKPAVDEPDCLSAHLRSVQACSTATAVAVSAKGTAAEARAVTSGGGTYLPVTPWLCTSARCPAMVGNMLVYRDDNHLSTAYTRWLAPVLAPQLDAAMRGR